MITSLYLHIPFCVKKCIYCDFFSVRYDEALVSGYVASAVHELDVRKKDAGELKTVYIGGGTPTVVPTGSLVTLLRAIGVSFALAPDAEITMEANPGTIDREKARALADAGVNRFSIGVQSFDDRELRLLGRIHTAEDVRKATSAVREADVRNLSIDLVYGIPGQTGDSWSKTVATAIELAPEHISAYELTPERSTPLHEAIAAKTLEMPPEETVLAMYSHAIDTLGDRGYGHYEISNFAKPGFRCRHNVNYWDRGQYIGIGASAHSFIGNRRMRNTSDIAKYRELLQKGELPVDESIEVSPEEAVREFIFLGLRKREGLDITKMGKTAGDGILNAAREFVDQGLIEVDKDILRLTRGGIVVSNTVIAGLFQKLGL
jgi:oxygen-independent coproporphyrinogen-3 oxidase